jgi:hypothetical protein
MATEPHSCSDHPVAISEDNQRDSLTHAWERAMCFFGASLRDPIANEFTTHVPTGVHRDGSHSTQTALVTSMTSAL